ncbi:MAG: hypothetical protein AB9869_24280 [Verrucomicrobiia bacterium]
MFMLTPMDGPGPCENVTEERIISELGLRTLPDWLTAIYEHIEPWRLPLLEPRRFAPPGGYHSPKSIPAGLDAILRGNELKTDAKRVPTEITAQAIAYEIINHRVPVYYAAQDFVRAVAATVLPPDFTLNDLHWPMPAMVLGFPVRFMREYLGTDTGYVYAADFGQGEHGCPFLPATPVIIMPKAKVAFWWYACVEGRLESFVSSYWKEDHVGQVVQRYAYTDYTGADALKAKADKERCDLLSALMLKLLVVLNTRPNLVEPATRLRAAGTRKGKARTALWSPNIIGRHYQVLRDRTAPTGTHASPRLHWRRGHLRNQSHGEGRLLRKLIWLEPTLVGFQEEGNHQRKETQ